MSTIISVQWSIPLKKIGWKIDTLLKRSPFIDCLLKTQIYNGRNLNGSHISIKNEKQPNVLPISSLG